MNQQQELRTLQRRVIKYTYFLTFFSVLLSLILGFKEISLSMILGSFYSLAVFNTKLNNTYNTFSTGRQNTGRSVFSYFFAYTILFFLLIIVKFKTTLDIWWVLTYALSTNFILILLGIIDSVKHKK